MRKDMKDIYQISENIVGVKERIFVRATIGEIYERQYKGGFRRFNMEMYDFGSKEKYPRGARIDGSPILSIAKFDKWLKEHKCA